ncbi:MAG: hypothetical protein ACREQQ_09440 [Candidatus Binatia bacterium]
MALGSAEEAATLGPTLARLASAIRTACDGERVYVIALGENSLHCHLLLMARRADAPPAMRGAGLLDKHAELADPDEARRLADAVRRELSRGH